MAGNSRRAMVHSVEQSLRRLRTDRIDVYWAQYDDAVTPIEEVVAAFDDLVRDGKILYGGLSNFASWRVARGQTITELRGLAALAGLHLEHSLVERTAEREMIPMAEALGLGAALYSPLGGGLLSGIHRQGHAGSRPPLVYREDAPARTSALDALADVADEVGASMSQVAVAWQRSMARRATTALVTIIGPRTVAQLDDYLAALEVALLDAHHDQLCAASSFERGVPFDGIGGPPDLGDHSRLDTPVVPVP